MERLIAHLFLIATTVAAPLAGAELEPRDLTPVTWLEAPAHPPVEVVRDGAPRAVVYLADPRATEKFHLRKHG